MTGRRCLLLGALTLAGCSRLDEVLGVVATDAAAADLDADLEGAANAQGDADGGSTDADTDDGADGAGLGQGPFGPVSVIAAIAAGEDPSLTGDQLELFYAMPPPRAPVAIWATRRLSTSATWAAGQVVSELGSPANEPCVSRDGLTLWFARPGSADAAPSSHIWMTTRATTTASWNAPQLVAELVATGYDDEKPSVDDASLVMAFMSNRPGGAGGLDLWVSTRASPGDAWGRPVNVSELNTTADERDPFLAGNDLQLYWASGVSGAESIRVATRSSPSGPFVFDRILTELGTPNLDPTLSVDLHHILFASRRGASRVQQLYEAFR